MQYFRLDREALPGVLGSWGERLLNFWEQGEIAIILREPGSKLLILGSWGALSKMIMVWLLEGGGAGRGAGAGAKALLYPL